MRSKLQAKEMVKGFESVLRVDEIVENDFDWDSLFDSRPVSLEIGMGKGSFITTLARECSNEFFLGLEVKEERVLSAAERAVGFAPQPSQWGANKKVLSAIKSENVKFLLGHADDLGKIGLDDRVSTIYLNFSDPWPKKKHIKRRLTAPKFLDIYKGLLKPNGKLLMKTDNKIFFNYTLEELPENGWRVLTELRDHQSRRELITEFEQRFLDKGLPIYFLEARCDNHH